MLVVLKSKEMQAYKKNSVLFHSRNDYGHSFVTGVKKLKPTHIMTFKTKINKLEIVSRHQIIIQTQSQLFVYRFTPCTNRFGQCTYEFSMKNCISFAYQLSTEGFIQKFCIALDRTKIATGKMTFEFENEKII